MWSYGSPVTWRLLITVTNILLATIQYTVATTYHVAMPIVESVPTTDVALLHVSGAATPITPTVSTPITGCSPTITDPDIVLPNACKSLFPTGVGVSQTGIRVSHDDDFRLHVLPISATGTKWGDGYLAIPDEHLGTEYYVITYCRLGGKCQFSVLGTKDDTSVNIRFPAQVNTVTACINGNTHVSLGDSTPFTINENDAINIQSTDDLSTTYITSDEPIAVFVGSSGIEYQGTTTTQIFEQLPPTRKWLREYYVVPNDRNAAGDITKIVTGTDNTVIKRSGFSRLVINKNKALELRNDWRMFSRIEATNPIVVMQVMSVDLYNDTDNVWGPPAMVVAQGRSHWSDKARLQCSNDDTDVSSAIVSFVADGTASAPPLTGFNPGTNSMIPEQPNIKVYVREKTDVTGGYNRDIDLSGTKFGYTGYCVYSTNQSASAMLLSNDLIEDTEWCVPSIGTPGDDIDNDCDEEVDEETCTVDDLQKKFNSTELGTGGSSQYFVGMGLDSYIKFQVQTCDVAEVVFWCSSDPEKHVSLQISKDEVNLHVHGGDSNQDTTSPPNPCTEMEHYWLQGTRSSSTTEITAGYGATMGSASVTVTTQEDCFDTLTFHSLTGDAAFIIDSGKDCKKIISNTADNHGVQFVIPVIHSDSDFDLYITGDNVGVELNTPDMASAPHAATVTGNALKIQKSELAGLTAYPHGLILTTADEVSEVSVYLVRRLTAGDTPYGLHLLPTDILGPAYHKATLNYDPTTSKCKLFSINRRLEFSDETIADVTEYESEEYTGDEFFESKSVMPAFCGDFAKSVVQIPPRETLGTDFYIPSIPFTTHEIQSAHITVVTTEDSTYIKILGDYDQEDVEDITGTRYERGFTENQVYTMETNKPVLAYLEFKYTDGRTHTLVLPPTSQYKTSTKHPGFMTIVASYCVDNNGTMLPSGVTTAGDKTFTEPTSCMTFVTDADVTKHIILSDFNLEDSEVCVVTDGVSVGIDDDCDGLVDEEFCLVTLDGDIDGGVFEDCRPDDITGGYTLPSYYTLTVDATHIDCNSGGSSTGTQPATSQSPSPTPMPTGGGTLAPAADPTIPSESSPIYEPIDTLANSSSAVLLNTSGNATVQTCDCVCPCGWVQEQNMTEAELMIKVEQIQEKLKIKKTELSAWIRKKTSAQDNRPSATAVGSAGVAFLVTTLTTVFLLDLATLLRDLRMFRDNLRQAFEN